MISVKLILSKEIEAKMYLELQLLHSFYPEISSAHEGKKMGSITNM